MFRATSPKTDAAERFQRIGKDVKDRISHDGIMKFLELDETHGFIGSFVYDSRFKLDKDLKKFGDRYDELIANHVPHSKAGLLTASRRSYLKNFMPKRHLTFRFVLLILMTWLVIGVMLWGVDCVTTTVTGERMPWARECTGVFLASSVLFFVLQLGAEAIQSNLRDWFSSGHTKQTPGRELCRAISEDGSSDLSDGEDMSAGRSSQRLPLRARSRTHSIDQPDWKDVVFPQEAVDLERKANVAQFLFSSALFVVFAQCTWYMQIFAVYFPQACPTERGPYSCTRLERIIHLDGVGSRFYPPRFNALNWDPVLQAPNCSDPSRCGLEAIPFGLPPPRIINSSVWGKELFAVVVHLVPLLFAALWILEVRRLSTRLAYTAYNLAALGDNDDGDDNAESADIKDKFKRMPAADLGRVEEERNSPMQSPRMHRRRLFFLALIYHIVLPDYHRSTRRLGRIILDAIDVQDFFLLLLEFDVYEGMPMSDQGLHLSGFDRCNFSLWDEMKSNGTKKKPRVTCNCFDRQPPWWLHDANCSANIGHLPCEALEQAATEWRETHEDIWLGHGRSPFWARLDITNWLFAGDEDAGHQLVGHKLAEWTWYVISAVFVISSLSVTGWPLVLVFRRDGSWIPMENKDEDEEEEGGHPQSLYWRKRHKMDNKESYMSAVRSFWSIELPFLVIRMYISFVCGVSASSLLIKNFINILIDISTIMAYHVWSMSHPNSWPEVYKEGQYSCHDDGWSVVSFLTKSCISRKWWVQQFSYAIHRKLIINTNEDNIDEEALLDLLGLSDEDIIVVNLVRKNATNQLRRAVKIQSDKSESHWCLCHRRYKSNLEDEINHHPPTDDKVGIFIVLPRQDQELFKGLHISETLEPDSWILYEDFDCERHVLADLAGMFWPAD